MITNFNYHPILGLQYEVYNEYLVMDINHIGYNHVSVKDVIDMFFEKGIFLESSIENTIPDSTILWNGNECIYYIKISENIKDAYDSPRQNMYINDEIIKMLNE